MNTKPEETQSHHQTPTDEAPHAEKTHHQTTKPEETQSHHQTPTDEAPQAEKWGTHVMGQPSAPSAHPNNKKAALWSAEEHNQPQHPYVQPSPIEGKQSSSNPMEPVIHTFNTWTHKAETLARNIWQNLKTGSSLSDAVYGKVGLTTKVVTGGGFESLYKQTFGVTDPNEKLKRTFACYLSTATGPVAGTMYLTNINIAFCSDRPLSFPAPSGQESWSYYNVMIPLAKISSINPITVKENPAEKYIQIATVDNHDFWFMGFVNYDKATNHLAQSFSEFNSMPAADHHHGQPPMPAADHHHGTPVGSEYDNAPPSMPAADHHQTPGGPVYDNAPPPNPNPNPAADHHHGTPVGNQYDNAPPPMPAADHHHGLPGGPVYDNAPPPNPNPAADHHHGTPVGNQYDNAPPMPAADHPHGPPVGPA